mmetsp:Transcript_24686/g.36196  ORF Transcript_24686/g.36196 Transcript_24686/m.36196 type:complete len:242 (+) Transcript_24686:103-828(+)
MFPEKIRNKHILELGSGTGLVGISSFLLGASNVVTTDLPCALPLMKHNIEQNCVTTSSNNNDEDDNVEKKEKKCIDCAACDWFDPPPIQSFGFSSSLVSTFCSHEELERECKSLSSSASLPLHQPDVILVADCVWLEELVVPLLDTLNRYTTATTTCNDTKEDNDNEEEDNNHDSHHQNETKQSSSSSSTKIIMTYQQRGKATHDLFWTKLHSIFRVQEIDTCKFGLYKPSVLYVLECQRK